MSKQTQNRIKKLRKQAKLSQQTLADQIGVFRNTISNWETGYSQISLENAKKVAEYFGVTIEYLLGSESE
ncbi:TPA: helix-turn-helix transcriptional regulator [Streptococcus pneumoniae]|uniref:helix-turn-helix transcriptional regulator n=1 Tax=Streptococcus infantis TaxID=68892 RepID=UPI002DD56D37|nr:helix-turn-helix transcriptional regulator [Streptococcus pneumoniae]HEV1212048.1 helix-turn-helix transcriptional regulator [Streptococcus pneumoniae]HEV1243479.1 helix-turn-helix transcriptional regulator [Streptococcus pneumoniae]